MTRLAFSAATLAVLAVMLAPAIAQQQDLVNSARQANVVNVQFFADSNFQQMNTPFAYYNFPAISAGYCSPCEDFPVRQARPPCIPSCRNLELQLTASTLEEPQNSRADQFTCFVGLQDAPIQWGSAVIAYSPTGGEGFQVSPISFRASPTLKSLSKAEMGFLDQPQILLHNIRDG